MEEEQKNKKTFYKKWWFWVSIVAIVVVLSFLAIVLLGFYLINPDKNLASLASDLQKYDNNIAVYQSAGKNTILINCKTQTTEEAAKKSEDIEEIIGKYVEYLSVYENIEFDFYTEKGERITFTFNIETREMEEEISETWILEDSTAYNERQKEIEELGSKKDELSTEISSLESKKQTLNSEIEQLNGEVIKLKGTPMTYPAGQLTVGTDIPVGKYKIYDGNSNFIVYSSTGNLEVNIILGSGNYNVSEYIYTFKEGDKVEARSSFKLVEVE